MAEATLEAEEAGTLPPLDPDSDFESDAANFEVEPAQEPELEPARSGGPVLLKDRYLIDSSTPLPNLDSPSAKAYAVEDRRDLSQKLFALVCSPGLPTRIQTIRRLKDEEFRGVLPLVEWGVIPWPLLGERTMIIIYQRPMGGRVVDRLARKEVRITEYDLPRRLVEPLAAGLQNLMNLDGPHRALRPNNIYFLDEEMTEVVLGENVTSPPGYDQPMIFEPIERAMATRSARGIGDSRDDVYALGVTLVMLMLGYNPLAKMKDEEQLRLRLEQGTYTTLCGNERVPMPLLEPFRAMLHDEREQRWDFNEIANYLSGQKMDPTQKKALPKADATIRFRGKDHASPRLLAYYLAKHVTDAAKLIRDDEFINWVRRNLNNSEKADAIKGAVQTAKFHEEGFQGTDDHLVAKVTAILDPDAPMRYKGLAMMPDGFGPMLAVEWIRKGNAQPPIDLINHDIPSMWFGAQPKPYRGASEYLREFGQFKGRLTIKEPGFGLERVLYESCIGMACQSPLIADDYVIHVEDLLPALDRAANNADRSARPMDHHIASFIAARFDQDIHPHLKAIASTKAEVAIVGVLSLLAFLQWKLRNSAVLGLSSWVGGLLGPAINTYHNRHTRNEIESEIPRLVRKGSLPELFDLIDNAERRHADASGYAEACAEWLAAEQEIRDIEGKGDERVTKAERSGQQAAAMISITLTLAVITIVSLLQSW